MTHSPTKSTAASGPALAEPPALALVGATGGRGRAKRVPRRAALAGRAGGFSAQERAVIDAALAILRARLARPGGLVNTPAAVRELLVLHLGHLEYECFVGLFLNARCKLVALEEIARGSLFEVTVCPREVVKAALRHNAVGLIVAHNHPSGAPEPSEADQVLTRRLREALALVEVRLFDHFIVAGDRAVSLAELGLLRSSAAAQPPAA